MDKEIAISIRPENVKNILNGIKTIEVRTKFPNISKIKVYIYVTKGTPLYLTGGSYDNFSYSDSYEEYVCDKAYYDYDYWYHSITPDDFLNGKVVASFIVDKVEEIKLEEYDDYNYSHYSSMNFETKTLKEDDLCKRSCLTADELDEYLGLYKEKDVYGYAIHISDLEKFYEPKELSELGIKRAPQNWMYVR